MRILVLLITAFMLLAGGFDSSAWAGETRIELRPGLILTAGDGRIRENSPQLLDLATDHQAKRKILTQLVREHPSSHPDFDTSCSLILGDSEHISLEIGSRFGRDMELIWFVTRNAEAARADSMEYPANAKVNMIIDDWLIESDQWQQHLVGYKLNQKNEEIDLLYTLEPYPVETRAKLLSEFISAAEKGRTMTYKIELKNGETFSGSYNLAGLTEAYNLLLQKRAEATQAAEREFEDLKKQLAALE